MFIKFKCICDETVCLITLLKLFAKYNTKAHFSLSEHTIRLSFMKNQPHLMGWGLSIISRTGADICTAAVVV
jgi:hypothetical protein